MAFPSVLCGWCGEKVYAQPVIEQAHASYRYWLARCPNCQQYMLVRRTESTGQEETHPRPVRTFTEKYAPESVRADFNDALKCWSVGSVKGFACMARRALDNSTIQLGAKGKDLWNRLEDLYKKGLITDQIRNVAHGIRAFGKHGAHPTESEEAEGDPLADLTEEDAQTIHDFMLWYLSYVYRSKEFEQKLKTDPRLKGAVPS